MLDTKKIHIFYACDDNFVKFTIVSFFSMKKNASRDKQYHIHVLHTNIKPETQERMLKLADECFTVTFDNVSDYLNDLCEKLPLRDYYSNTTYYRMFIADMYPELDKAIYIDSDTVVTGDISELYGYDITEYDVAACHEQAMVQADVYGTYVEKCLGIDRNAYFNAGILLINCKKFREKKVLEDFVRLLGIYDFRVTQDEDYLNIICRDHVLWLPQTWNTEMFGELLYPIEEANIVHYIMTSKPWHYEDCRHGDLFWSYADSLKVVALGSSRMSMGFNALGITNGPAINLASIPSDMDISLYLAKNYIFNHCGQLEFIVVGLDFDLWSEAGSVNIARNLLSFRGYLYDVDHNFWTDYGADEIKSINRTILEENEFFRPGQRSMGWVEVNEGYSWESDGEYESPFVDDSIWSDNPDSYMRNMIELEELVEIAANKGVHVIGVIFPQSPYYKQTGAYGRHGMRRSHAEQLMEEVKRIGNRHPNFTVMDENKMGDHDYPDSLAYDYDHLNADGGKVLTARIDSLMQTLK